MAGAEIKDVDALPFERCNAVAKARALDLPATEPDALAAVFTLPRALGGDFE